MKRFWITFTDPGDSNTLPNLSLGVGVTAENRSAALEIVKNQIFGGDDIPEIREAIENVEVSTLDPNHVLPNMGMPLVYGIWFPMGYQTLRR